MMFPFETLFAVVQHAFGLSKRCHSKAEASADKPSKSSEFEDPFAFPEAANTVRELEEPCAEPDVEPPVEQERPAPVVPQKSSRRLPAAAAILAFTIIALFAIDSPAPIAPPAAEAPAAICEGMACATEAVAAVETVDSVEDIAMEEEVPRASNESSADGSSGDAEHKYEVYLTRHSFPVSTVGDIVYYRSAYFGTLHVGSPAVPFKVVFDTGSGHLILPSTYCQSETCRAHRRYRRGDSHSAKDIDYDGTPVLPGQPRDQITVSFGTGEVTGVFIEDVVCMHGEEPEAIDNSSAGVAASQALQVAPGANTEALERGCVKLRMIAATHMSEEPFKSFQFDGVLGLGLDGLSQAPEFNFLDIVANSFGKSGGKTPHTFAVFLAEDTEEESKITFGGWDEDNLMEDLSWNSVLDPEQGHWTIRIKALRIDDGEPLQLCEEGCKGVVDTGTSLLAVPAMAFSELYTLLRHPAHMEGHCHGPGPNLHIELEHFTITLGPEDYARLERTPPRKTRPRFESKPYNVSAKGRTDLHCKPMLMSMDLPAPLGPKLFILGEPILRKYYSVYDAAEKRVGFARARHHSKPTWPLPPHMTPALKLDARLAEKSASRPRSMFEVFRWRKLHR